MPGLENSIAALIGAQGPLTGAELSEQLGGESLTLWQACYSSELLAVLRLGQRYLRLDTQVEGYARLSPSILREFLTYSLVGLASDPEPLERRRRELASSIEAISREKEALASRFILGIREQFSSASLGPWPEEKLCVILAGDVVYRMAHRVPRPERSTGKMVDGSDIDLVIVLADDVPGDFIRWLDRAIYQSKYMALVSPAVREEFDYVVKKMERVIEQLRFDSFKHMLACKILHEGVLLHGSKAIFADIKSRLREQGIVQKLEDMEKQAHASRKARQEYLLCACPAGAMEEGDKMLFYSAEESEEFE